MDIYKPVGCDFHDELEAIAVKKQSCRLSYVNKSGALEEVIGHIADLYTKDHEEFLKLNNGLVLRLDQISRLNGHRPGASD